MNFTKIFASLEHALSSAASVIAKGATFLQGVKPLVDTAVGLAAGPGAVAITDASYAALGTLAAEISRQKAAGTFDPTAPLTVTHSAMLVQGVAAILPTLESELATIGVKVPTAVNTVANQAAAVAAAVTTHQP